MKTIIKRQHKEAGFTLMELMIVMFIVSLLIVPIMNAFMDYVESRRIDTTVGEVSDLTNSAQYFASDNTGTWPDQLNNCAGAVATLTADGYLAGFSNTNVFGQAYTTSCPLVGTVRRFVVTTSVVTEDRAQVMTGILPSTTAVNEVLTTSVPLPAEIPALSLLLALDGKRPMTGDLDMGGNDIGNAKEIVAEDITSSVVRYGTQEAKLSNGIHFAGIVNANKLSEQYPKLTCMTGQTAIPIVVPAGNSSTQADMVDNSQPVANPIGAQYAYAEDLGTAWRFRYKMSVYRNNAWELNHFPGANSNFLAVYFKCS